MRYFIEMSSEWGFSRGETVPPAVEELRTIYYQTLNALLQRFGSSCRVIRLNSTQGNSVRLYRVPVNVFERLRLLETPDKQWHNFVRNLDHLPPQVEKAVLRRERPYEPQVFGDATLRLYSEVQAKKGDTRQNIGVVETNGQVFVCGQY